MGWRRRRDGDLVLGLLLGLALGQACAWQCPLAGAQGAEESTAGRQPAGAPGDPGWPAPGPGAVHGVQGRGAGWAHAYQPGGAAPPPLVRPGGPGQPPVLQAVVIPLGGDT